MMKRLAFEVAAAVLVCCQTIRGQSVAKAALIEAPPLSFTRITLGLHAESPNDNSEIRR